MASNWLPLIHPLELYGVLALTGACLLYAFLLHMKMRMFAERAREQREYLESRVAQVLEAVERLRVERDETARPSPVAAAGQPLNLNKRGQVLRMRRRGENPETIAGALGIPRHEVDLLLKVHQMALESVEKSATQAAG
jgi:DNA invertase Pin-like site-specific DNA recombinase